MVSVRLFCFIIVVGCVCEMASESEANDSFDRALASMDMPCDPKKAKLVAPPATVVASTSSASTSSSSAVAAAATITKSPMKRPATSQHHISVHPKQRGNPLLKSITNVPWEFDEIVPDYVVGISSCILFLSLKYHSLNPDYIHNRLKLLGKHFELRVLLVQVDTKVSGDAHAQLYQ